MGSEKRGGCEKRTQSYSYSSIPPSLFLDKLFCCWKNNPGFWCAEELFAEKLISGSPVSKCLPELSSTLYVSNKTSSVQKSSLAPPRQGTQLKDGNSKDGNEGPGALATAGTDITQIWGRCHNSILPMLFWGYSAHDVTSLIGESTSNPWSTLM